MVRTRAMTSREVQIQNLLEVALYNKNPADKLVILGLDSKVFAKAVQDSLLEYVVSEEAQNFSAAQVQPDEVQMARKKVTSVVKASGAWKGLQVSDREFEDGIRRKMQAKKFIQFRALSSVMPVTDSEAEKYFNENRLKFGNLPFQNFKENIKSYLGRNQVDRRMKDWFEVLLSKYQVKNLIAEN